MGRRNENLRAVQCSHTKLLNYDKIQIKLRQESVLVIAELANSSKLADGRWKWKLEGCAHLKLHGARSFKTVNDKPPSTFLL
jgi:hypothetical protein